MHRVLALLIVTLSALLLAPAIAAAATYDVLSCGAAPEGVNRSWLYSTNSIELEGAHPTPCSFSSLDPSRFLGESSSGAFGGLWARTIIPSGTPLPATGAFAQWSITAPAGTTITGLSIRRWLGLEAGSGWVLYGRIAGGTLLPGETCTVISGADECNVGGPMSGWADFIGLSTGSIAYGFRCQGAGGCGDGSFIHAARAAVYAARVTIADPTQPDLGAASGPLLDAGDRAGIQAVTTSGRDQQGGLAALRAYVDDETTPRATATFPCDETLVQPCPTTWTSGTLSLDTTALRDGLHRVVLAAVDAGGNERRGTAQSFRTENHAPASPRNLTISGTPPEVTLSWDDPPDSGAAIVAAHYEVCPANGGGCVSGRSTGRRTIGVRLPHHGRWEARVWLEDAAGHVERGNAARVTVDHPAPPVAAITAPTVPTPDGGLPLPTTTPTPTSAVPPAASVAPEPKPKPRTRITSLTRSARTLRLRGRVDPSTATLVITLDARAGRHALRERRRVTTKNGRFDVTLRLPRTARGHVQVRASGADTVRRPLPRVAR